MEHAKQNLPERNELRLYIPKPEDGWFYMQMLSDPATMSYNAPWFPPDGCVPFTEADWPGWYKKWIGQEPERFYAYLQCVTDGAFVGSVNFHYTLERDWWDMGIVIFAPERGKGYGRQGLRLLCDRAFRVNGIPRLHNDFEPTREAALHIHKAIGFRETGVENGIVQLLLTKEEYLGTQQERYPYRGLILRDYQESDIDDELFWNTGHHPWMDWDAPWEGVEQSEPEQFRADRLAFIAAEKSTPRWRLQIEVDGARIGSVNAYRIGEDYDDVSREEAKTKKWYRAVGIVIQDDRYWGRGYGTIALEAWLSYLLEHDVPELYLQTWSGNERMIHVAEKLGFVECSRRIGLREWQGNRYDALTFRLDVPAFQAARSGK